MSTYAACLGILDGDEGRRIAGRPRTSGRLDRQHAAYFRQHPTLAAGASHHGEAVPKFAVGKVLGGPVKSSSRWWPGPPAAFLIRSSANTAATASGAASVSDVVQRGTAPLPPGGPRPPRAPTPWSQLHTKTALAWWWMRHFHHVPSVVAGPPPPQQVGVRRRPSVPRCFFLHPHRP